MRRVGRFEKQCMKSGSSVMNGYYMQSSMDKGNQEITENMLFDDGLRCLKAKCDFITLKVQLNTITNMLEQKRNFNAFNSYHEICDLCGGYHTTHICRQAQNERYYNELGYYNPYFDQNGPNWSNSYTYGWDNQCAYSDSSYFYDYLLEYVQYESKTS